MSGKVNRKEVGRAVEIPTEKIQYIFHLEDNPVAQARAIKELIDMGYSQREIAEMLGRTQQFVSARLQLLKLIPELQEAAMRGDISKSTALKLARLPKEVQEEFAERLKRGEKIRFKEVAELAREEFVRSVVEKAIAAVPPLPTEAERRVDAFEWLVEELGKLINKYARKYPTVAQELHELIKQAKSLKGKK